MDRSRMIGYWEPDRPVKTGHARLLATTGARMGRPLAAMASWTHTPVEATLVIDRATLGTDRTHAPLEARAAAGFQPAQTFRRGEVITVTPGRGWLIEIRER